MADFLKGLKDKYGTETKVTVAESTGIPFQVALERSYGQNEPDAPSWLELYPEDPTRTSGQRRSEKAAKTAYQNALKEFQHYGQLERFNKFVENEGEGNASIFNKTMENVIDPTFDLISIGNYTLAGFAQEALRTGSAWEAFKQASIELGNALPMVDIKGAREPSFIDVFQEHGYSNWEGMTAGWVMDLVVDPINLIPFAFFAKAAKATIKPLHALEKIDRVQGVTDIVKAMHLPGEEFLQHFDKIGRSRGIENFREYGQRFLDNVNAAETAIRERKFEMEEYFKKLFTHLQPHEAKMLGLYMDQPERLMSELAELVPTGIITENNVAQIKVVEGTLRRVLDDHFAEAEYWGMLESSQYRDHYLHGMEALFPEQAVGALDPVARRAQQKVLKERRSNLPQGERFAPGQKRSTDNNAERLENILAGTADYTTELDVRNIMYKRTFDHIRHVEGKKLIMLAASDGNISMKVADDIAQSSKKLAALRKQVAREQPGYDILVIEKKAGLGLSKPASGMRVPKTLRKEKVYKSPEGGPDVPLVEGAFIMPKVIVDYVSKMDQLFKDDTVTNKLLKAWDSFNSIWKSYAVLSWSYHARNQQSIMLMNWMAGVGSKYSNLLKGKIEVPMQYWTRHLQGLQVQLAHEGASQVPERIRAAVDQVARRAGYKSFADVPFPKVAGPDGKLMTAKDVARAGSSLDVPQSATKAWNVDPEMMSRLWKTSPMKADDTAAVAQSGASDLTKAALTMGETATATAVGKRPRKVGSAILDFIRPSGSLVQFNRGVSVQIENWGRWTLFLDKLMKGTTKKEAAEATKLWHFDYRRLTDWEKQANVRMMPFFAWARFAGPRMFMAFLEDPAKMARMPKTKNAFEKLSEDHDELPKPDYYAETQAIQTPFVMNDKPLYVQIDNPILELNQYNLNDILARLGPIPKLFSELLTSNKGGYNIFLDRPIERFEGEEVQSFFKNMGLTKMQEHVLETLAPPVGRYITRPAKAAERDELAPWLISELTGAKLRGLDPRRVFRGQKYQKARLAREFRKILKQEGIIPKERPQKPPITFSR